MITNLTELQVELSQKEQNLARKRLALASLVARLDGFPSDVSLSFGYIGDGTSIDIDNTDRAITTALISYLKAGIWTKEPAYNATINYVNTTLLNIPIRIYGAEPPPSCKIVEEDVEIPAQPARIEKRKRVVCPSEHQVDTQVPS